MNLFEYPSGLPLLTDTPEKPPDEMGQISKSPRNKPKMRLKAQILT